MAMKITRTMLPKFIDLSCHVSAEAFDVYNIRHTYTR